MGGSAAAGEDMGRWRRRVERIPVSVRFEAGLSHPLCFSRDALAVATEGRLDKPPTSNSAQCASECLLRD